MIQRVLRLYVRTSGLLIEIEPATTEHGEKDFEHIKIFGGGTVVKSIQKCCVPVQIGEVACLIWIEITEGNLPLLLGLKSTKRAQACLDTGNNAFTIGEGVKSHFLGPREGTW